MARHNSQRQAAGRVRESDYLALAEFRYQVRRFLRFSEGNARKAGLHPQQHRLLLAIKGMPSELMANIGNLAENLQIQHHSAVELIDRTVTSGLVARRTHPGDRRVVTVHITPRGERLLHKLSWQNREELRSAAPALVKTLRALTTEQNT